VWGCGWSLLTALTLLFTYCTHFTHSIHFSPFPPFGVLTGVSTGEAEEVASGASEPKKEAPCLFVRIEPVCVWVCLGIPCLV
jgi:hypothetical protein